MLCDNNGLNSIFQTFLIGKGTFQTTLNNIFEKKAHWNYLQMGIYIIAKCWDSVFVVKNSSLEVSM